MQPAEPLQQLNDGATLKDLLVTDVSNMHVCRTTSERLSGLQEWARGQGMAP